MADSNFRGCNRREVGKDDETDTDDNEIELWTREETPLIEIPIDHSRKLKLRQHTSQEDLWGIHSTVWDGGVGTLAYLLAQESQQRVSQQKGSHC